MTILSYRPPQGAHTDASHPLPSSASCHGDHELVSLPAVDLDRSFTVSSDRSMEEAALAVEATVDTALPLVALEESSRTDIVRTESAKTASSTATKELAPRSSSPRETAAEAAIFAELSTALAPRTFPRDTADTTIVADSTTTLAPSRSAREAPGTAVVKASSTALAPSNMKDRVSQEEMLQSRESAEAGIITDSPTALAPSCINHDLGNTGELASQEEMLQSLERLLIRANARRMPRATVERRKKLNDGYKAMDKKLRDFRVSRDIKSWKQRITRKTRERHANVYPSQNQAKEQKKTAGPSQSGEEVGRDTDSRAKTHAPSTAQRWQRLRLKCKGVGKASAPSISQRHSCIQSQNILVAHFFV